jgi:hypothetical protein
MMEREYTLKFEWYKPEKGYIWRDCDIFRGFSSSDIIIPDGPYLIECDDTQCFLPWNPFEDATTFARFADVQPNDDALCAWANENGRLVRSETLSDGSSLNVLTDDLVTGFVNVVDGKRLYARTTESRQFWYKEHFDLSFAVMVWEFILNNDVDSLRKIVIWQGQKRAVIMKFRRDTLGEIYTRDDGAISYPTFDEKNNLRINLGFEVLFDADLNMRSWAPHRFPYPDIINPARLFIQTEVNTKLHEYPLQIALTLNEHGELEKRLYPTSLLSAMWYQLYLALAGEITLRRCSICGKWEDMSGHRVNWSKHKKCISYERIKKYNLAREK